MEINGSHCFVCVCCVRVVLLFLFYCVCVCFVCDVSSGIWVGGINDTNSLLMLFSHHPESPIFASLRKSSYSKKSVLQAPHRVLLSWFIRVMSSVIALAMCCRSCGDTSPHAHSWTSKEANVLTSGVSRCTPSDLSNRCWTPPPRLLFFLRQ